VSRGHRSSGPILGALVSAILGFALALLVNHFGGVLLWTLTPFSRFSWSIPGERNIEILSMIAYIVVVLFLLAAAVRPLVNRGFQPMTALFFGFSLGCSAYLLVGLLMFAWLTG
jgi:hypothetical protein